MVVRTLDLAEWEAWIAGQAKARACPRDYVAAGLIAAASTWIGNARRIAATADWIEPAHLWIALIGAPSAGKTPALQPMIAASRALERDAEPAWHERLARYERDAEAARANDKSWREAVRSAAAEGSPLPNRPAGAEELMDLVDPASALGVFIDKFGLAGQRVVYTKDFAAYRRIEVACGLD